MAAVNVFEMIMSGKRSLEQVSPSVEHLELYAAFVPPRKYLRRQRCIRVSAAAAAGPSSPPPIARVHVNDILQQVALENGRHNSAEHTPTLSFETERMSGTARYNENPRLVMQALIACMKRTERSRSRLFVNRKSFPKEILETSDRLLHRNTTRKKLIWAFEEELGCSHHVSNKGDREEDQSRDDASTSHHSVGESDGSDDNNAKDDDHSEHSCLTNSPRTPNRHSLLHRDHHNSPIVHNSPASCSYDDVSPRGHYSVASSYHENSPVRPILVELRSKSDEHSTSRSAFRSPYQHFASPGCVSFATPATPNTPGHFSYASNHSPSHVSYASDHSPQSPHFYYYDSRSSSHGGSVPRSIVRPVRGGPPQDDEHGNHQGHSPSHDSSCDESQNPPEAVPAYPDTTTSTTITTTATSKEESDTPPRTESDLSASRSKSITAPFVLVQEETSSTTTKQEPKDADATLAAQ